LALCIQNIKKKELSPAQTGSRLSNTMMTTETEEKTKNKFDMNILSGFWSWHGVSEQFLNGTSAQYRLYSAILIES